MTEKEFVKACQNAGYCKKKVAEEYAKRKIQEGQTEFSEKDFEAVYRLDERKRSDYWDMPHHSTHILFRGGRTTKSYTKNNDF